MRVLNRTQLRHEVDLIERNLASDRVLDMLHSTVRERATLDRQLAEFSLESLQQFLNHTVFTCYLKVIHMDGHQAGQHPRVVVPETQPVVDTALAHSTLLREDAYEFHLKSSWGIRKTRAWLVTVQHLFLGVTPSNPGKVLRSRMSATGK